MREAIKHRGECWRLSAMPKTREAKERMVFSSKVGIHGLPIYFYNRLTGTRWLTCQEFENLGKLDDAALARHLQEIADHAMLRNRLGRPEVDFFAADLRRFGARQFAGVVYAQLQSGATAGQVRRAARALPLRGPRGLPHGRLPQQGLVPSGSSPRCSSKATRRRPSSSSAASAPSSSCRSSGCRAGASRRASSCSTPSSTRRPAHPEDAELQRLCDPRAKGIIFNFIREFGDLEYINVGCMPESLSLDRPQTAGPARACSSPSSIRAASAP